MSPGHPGFQEGPLAAQACRAGGWVGDSWHMWVLWLPRLAGVGQLAGPLAAQDCRMDLSAQPAGGAVDSSHAQAGDRLSGRGAEVSPSPSLLFSDFFLLSSLLLYLLSPPLGSPTFPWG